MTIHCKFRKRCQLDFIGDNQWTSLNQSKSMIISQGSTYIYHIRHKYVEMIFCELVNYNEWSYFYFLAFGSLLVE